MGLQVAQGAVVQADMSLGGHLAGSILPRGKTRGPGAMTADTMCGRRAAKGPRHQIYGMSDIADDRDDGGRPELRLHAARQAAARAVYWCLNFGWSMFEQVVFCSWTCDSVVLGLI